MLIVYGAGDGGHVVAVFHYATRYGLHADIRPPEHMKWHRAYEGVVGLGCSDLSARVRWFDDMSTHGITPGLVVPRRYTAEEYQIGRGTVICPGVTIGAWVEIGQNVVIYSGSVVEHGSKIGDHAWLSPGVILCGNVTVKPRAFLGAGAIVLPGVTIGEGARIGAGAVIHGDVGDGVVVYGPCHGGVPMKEPGA